MKTKSLTAFLGILLVTFAFMVNAGAATTLGLSLEKDYHNDSILYGGFLRTGGLFKLELGGTKPGGSGGEEVNLLSYLLLDLTLGSFGATNGSFHLYMGGSPVISLDTSIPAFSFSKDSAYGKIGLEFNLFPFSIQAQTIGELDFTGELESLMAGVGFGLSF